MSSIRQIREVQDLEARLQQAAEMVIARQERTQAPEGEWTGLLWYPASGERQPCCDAITPIPANRQALESHCRTLRHIARLLDVSAVDLRRAVKKARQDAELRADGASGSGSSALVVGLEGLLREGSRGIRRDALGELREEAKRFEIVLPRLIAEGEENLSRRLEEAMQGVERLGLIVECCHKFETGHRSIKEGCELLTRLFELRKQSS